MERTSLQWRQIHVQNLQSAASLCRNNSEESTLPELGAEYMEGLFQRGLLRRQQKNNWCSLKDVLLLDTREVGCRALIDNLLSKVRRAGNGTRQDFEKLSCLYTRQLSNMNARIDELKRATEAAQAQNPEPQTSLATQEPDFHSDATPASHQLLPNPGTSTEALECRRSVRRFGTFDVPARKRLRELRGIAKLEKIKEIKAAIEAMPEGESYSNGLRVFESQVLGPVLRCLVHHCNDDAASFFERWTENFRSSRFSSECCTGRDAVCGSRV